MAVRTRLLGQVIPPSSGSSPDLSGDKGAVSQQEASSANQKFMLVMSGGEGYIDFRMGKHREHHILGPPRRALWEKLGELEVALGAVSSDHNGSIYSLQVTTAPSLKV